MNILLVEDDTALALGVEYALKKEGFHIEVCKCLSEARNALRGEIDLILLDVMLPDGQGYDFCREVRVISDMPIIFMTALEDEGNVVLGLDIGGDDYITKPVRIGELISRINAVMRRRRAIEDSKLQKAGRKIVSGAIEVEPLKCKVFVDKKEVLLTPIEYKLLILLIENRNNILTRNTLLERLWDAEGNFVETNTLNVYIRRLREKIETDLNTVRYIETVRGIGYRWKEEVEDGGII
ncbi:MAG: DNA-binding response regulator [Clostridia bacterium]|jgi:DNA-binding response OmpR family regulator|nr:DNA-binding response regulator [Clostridia bacterium]